MVTVGSMAMSRDRPCTFTAHLNRVSGIYEPSGLRPQTTVPASGSKYALGNFKNLVAFGHKEPW